MKARDSYSARKAALNRLSSRFDGFLLLAISSRVFPVACCASSDPTSDVPPAQVASGLLSGLDIPNQIYLPPTPDVQTNECYRWVPPERAAEARAALEQSSISDEELTRPGWMESGSFRRVSGRNPLVEIPIV